MKNKFSLLLIYIVGFSFSSALYISLFWINIFSSLDFLFFKSGFLLILSTGLILLIIILLNRIKYSIFKMMVFQDFLLIFIITIFINWFIYGLIPFNVSRSNSVIILKYLRDNDGRYKTKNDILNYVQDKYFNEYDAIGLRLSEQLKAGNIKKVGEEYFITEKGIFITQSFLFISKLYNLENNFLED